MVLGLYIKTYKAFQVLIHKVDNIDDDHHLQDR